MTESEALQRFLAAGGAAVVQDATKGVQGQMQVSTLASYVGEETAKNITAISGEKGAEALAQSFQNMKDGKTQGMDYSNFIKETLVNLKTVQGDDQEKKVAEAAAKLDQSSHSYVMGKPSTEASIKQALELRDKVKTLPDGPDKLLAHQTEKVALSNFFERTEQLIQEAYQKHGYNDPRIDPNLPKNKKDSLPNQPLPHR